MKPIVTVVDYGMGNLFSVRQAFESMGATVEIANTPAEIGRAERLVLPGVGAFADGMAGLRALDLVASLQDFAAGGRPFLGICLGMQMMLDLSQEFGEHAGLGLIPGKVVIIPRLDQSGKPHKIPHIGWNELQPPSSRGDWSKTILEDVTPGAAAYFVHSFTAEPANAAHRLADCYYNGRLISAAINKGSLYGCQFHPEKSGKVGLNVIQRFLYL